MIKSKAREPLKVLQIVEAALTGVGRHALDLCESLAERGCSVHVIYSPLRIDKQFERRLTAIADKENVTTFSLDMERSIGLSDLVAANRIRKYLREHGPFDIVHGHSSKGGALARLSSFGTGVPVYYTPNAVRTMNPLVSPRSRAVIAQIERALSWMTSRIIAVSPEERDHLQEIGINTRKISIVPNGIVPQELPSRREAREVLGLDQDAPIVGFVGRFSDQKGLDVLVKSIPEILDEIPNCQFAMIGHGENEQELKDLADHLEVSHCLHWLGQQKGFESMPAFDLFALPSRYEGLPYVLIETLMAGCPVVTTDLASSSMLVENGVNGVVVRAESPGEFADGVCRILADDSTRASMAKASVENSKFFTLDAMTSSTMELYLKSVGAEDRGHSASLSDAAS